MLPIKIAGCKSREKQSKQKIINQLNYTDMKTLDFCINGLFFLSMFAILLFGVCLFVLPTFAVYCGIGCALLTVIAVILSIYAD